MAGEDVPVWTFSLRPSSTTRIVYIVLHFAHMQLLLPCCNTGSFHQKFANAHRYAGKQRACAIAFVLTELRREEIYLGHSTDPSHHYFHLASRICCCCSGCQCMIELFLCVALTHSFLQSLYALKHALVSAHAPIVDVMPSTLTGRSPDTSLGLRCSCSCTLCFCSRRPDMGHNISTHSFYYNILVSLACHISRTRLLLAEE